MSIEENLILNSVLLDVKPVKLRKSIGAKLLEMFDDKNIIIQKQKAYIEHKCSDLAILNKALDLVCYDKARSFNPNGDWNKIMNQTKKYYIEYAKDVIKLCK